MTIKYFSTPDGHYWQLIPTQNVQGSDVNYALEMDIDDVYNLNTNGCKTNGEYIEDSSNIKIEHWFLWSSPEDLFDAPPENNDIDTSKLKQMLAGLKPTVDIYETTQTSKDILAMIRDRNQTVEMPTTVIINPKRFSNSTELEKVINEMQQRHGTNATILVGTTPPIPAEDLLATIKNKETIGISSYPDKTKPLGVTIDPETLEVIKKLRPKK